MDKKILTTLEILQKAVVKIQKDLIAVKSDMVAIKAKMIPRWSNISLNYSID